jgi:hypothetical protein
MTDYHFFAELMSRGGRDSDDDDDDGYEDGEWNDPGYGSDQREYSDDDDPDYDDPEPEPFNSWFVKCTRLYDMEPMQDRSGLGLRSFPPQRHCLEFEIRDGKTLNELVEALGQKQVADMILNQGFRERSVSRCIRGKYDTVDIVCVLWLSPSTFVGRDGHFAGIEREGWLNLLLNVELSTQAHRDSVHYFWYGLQRECRDDIPNKVLSWIDADPERWWTVVTFSSGPNALPFSTFAPWALKELVARSSGDREVCFSGNFHGLSRDQWTEVLSNCHPTAKVRFETDDMSPWLPYLLEALRHNLSPPRLMIQYSEFFEPIEDLTDALAGCASIRNLGVEIPSRSEEAIEAFLSAVEANSHLNTFEIRTHLTCEEWDRLWEVAESHATLATVRLSYEGFFDCYEHDRFEAVEEAVRNNVKLTGIEAFEDLRTHHRRHEYNRRILPLVRWNRIVNATNEVRCCADPSWRMRLFASSLYHRCGADTSNAETVSACMLMLRGNVDLIECNARREIGAGTATSNSNQRFPIEQRESDVEVASRLKRKHIAVEPETS